MAVFEIRHTLRHELDPSVMALLKAIADGLNRNSNQEQLNRIERKLQAMSDETRQLFQQLDDATNAVASRLEKLIGLTDNSDINTALQAEVTRLRSMGADPTNPLLTT